MKTQKAEPTLHELIEPLLELLNRQYPTDPAMEYLIPWTDQFGVLKPEVDAVVIELPDDLMDHEPAVRTIATLLTVTGSMTTWGAGRSPGDQEIGGPLRFSLTKRSAWAGGYWAGARYILVEHLTEAYDADAVTGQIDGLVARLDDPANLIEVSPEERALVF